MSSRRESIPLSIRQAEEAEADVVRDILLEAAGWLVERGIPLWIPEELDEATLRSDVTEGRYALALDGSVAVGTLRLDLEDSLFWPDLPGGDSAFVHRLAVRRSHAGRGVSTALLEWAVQRAREFGRTWLRLDCESDREKLRELYEGFGFAWHSDRQVGSFHAARYELELSERLPR